MTFFINAGKYIFQRNNNLRYSVNSVRKYLHTKDLRQDVFVIKQFGCNNLFVSSCFSTNQIYTKDFKHNFNREHSQNPLENYEKFKRFRPHNIKNEKTDEQTNLNAKEDNMRLVIAKNDPDTFGLLSKSNLPYTERYEHDEDDKKEEAFLDNPPTAKQKLRTKQYADLIKDHLKNKRIKEALDILENRMIKEDRVKPENYIYNLLIGACGRVGYTKKAFHLFNDMKKRGLKVTGGTYTGLFNACANSPWIEDGLQRANGLKELMLEKGYEPNDTNYNSMIKAFGRCGDIQTAFQLVDEMGSKNMRIDSSTFNFLLQACVSDKEAGFRHSLLVWRKMLNRKVLPDIFSYNLLLRIIRDCGIGDIDVTKELFEKIIQESKQLTSNSQCNETHSPTLYITDGDHTVVSDENTKSSQIVDDRPNLLDKNPHFGSIISLNEITKPEHRLLLVGGTSGLLKQMLNDGVSPDIKTYTQLLDVIPSTHVAEKALIVAMKKSGLKVDIDFFNTLIKKRSMRFDYASAKEVLTMITTAKLRPDIVTYGVLALGCKTEAEAVEIISQMNENGHRPNVQILGAMLQQGCFRHNFGYVLEIMETLLREKIKPNAEFINHLEKFQKQCSAMIKDRKTGGTKYGRFVDDDYFQKGFRLFCLRYKVWTEEINKEYPNLDTHPWEQFRVNQNQGFEEEKIFKRKYKKKKFLRKIT